MRVIREAKGIVLKLPAQPHVGWLPIGAATPEGYDAKDVVLNLAILALDPPDTGYILEFSSSEPGYSGDTWHESVELALQQAKQDFGVEGRDWSSVAK